MNTPMNLFEYLDAHPWWALVYLVIILLALSSTIAAMRL